VSGRVLVILVGIVIYLIISVVIGLYFTRRQRSLSHYFLAGKELGGFTVAMTVAATAVSGWAFVGAPGLGYERGYTYLVWTIGAVVIGLPMGWFLLARRIRVMADTHNCITVPDVLYARYGSEAVRVLGAISVFVGALCYLGVQLMAMGWILQVLFGISYTWGVIIGLVVMGLYTTLGGIEGAIYATVFQGTLMLLVSMFMVVFCWALVGGPGATHTAMTVIDPKLTTFMGTDNWPHTLSYMIAIGAGIIVFPHVITKYMMVKSITLIKWTPMVNLLLNSFMTLFVMILPMAYYYYQHLGLAPVLDDVDMVAPTFVLMYVPVTLAAVAFAAILAAIMSTGTAFINVAASAIIQDIARSSMHIKFKNEVFAARIGSVAVCIMALAIALSVDRPVGIFGAVASGIWAATLLPVAAIGLNWRRATREGAIAAMVVGLVLSFVLQLLIEFDVFELPYGMLAALPAILIALFVFYVVSKRTRGAIGEDLPTGMEQVFAIPLIMRPTQVSKPHKDQRRE